MAKKYTKRDRVARDGIARRQKDLIPRSPALRDDAVSERYNRGLANLRRITGQAGKGLTDTFDKTAPDLERYLMEFVFGDIYSRPALDVKQRQLAAIYALAALGTCQPSSWYISMVH